MFVLASVCLSAQTMNVPKVNSKFGKPTKEEMLMSVYEPDTTAAVVCLYKETEIYYEDLVNFYLGSYCSEVDADYYAIITMEDARDMQADLMSKYSLVE